MTEELRQELTLLYMLRGSEEMLHSKTLQSFDVQVPPPPSQTPRTSGTMPGGETEIAEAAPPEAPSALILRVAAGTRAVRMEHIRQIEIKDQFTWVHPTTHDAEPFIVLHTMKEMEQKIATAPQLVRCNQSCILNLAYCPLWKPNGKDARVCVVQGAVQQWHSVSRVYKAEFLRKWRKFYENP